MSDTIAERYARAIFEVGEEAGKLSVVAQHFKAFARVYDESHALRVALNDPVIDDATQLRDLKRRRDQAAIDLRVTRSPLLTLAAYSGPLSARSAKPE